MQLRMLAFPFSSLRVSPQHLHPNPVGIPPLHPQPHLQGACLAGMDPAAQGMAHPAESGQGQWERDGKEGGRTGGVCAQRLLEVVGTADKGRAAPAGIYEAALSIQGDEQSSFPGCCCNCSPLPTK